MNSLKNMLSLICSSDYKALNLKSKLIIVVRNLFYQKMCQYPNCKLKKKKKIKKKKLKLRKKWNAKENFEDCSLRYLSYILSLLLLKEKSMHVDSLHHHAATNRSFCGRIANFKCLDLVKTSVSMKELQNIFLQYQNKSFCLVGSNRKFLNHKIMLK